MILFGDAGCPFARRVTSLCMHLRVPLDVRESEIGSPPSELADHVSGKRLPVLVDDDLVLLESRVMLEHIADRFAFADAYPTELSARSRDRNAMALVDDYFAPMLFGASRAEPDALRFADAFRALHDAIRADASHPRLLTFHVAPILACFRLWHPMHPVTQAVRSHPAVGAWVDAALSIDALTRTALAPNELEVLLCRARDLGLVPSL